MGRPRLARTLSTLFAIVALAGMPLASLNTAAQTATPVASEAVTLAAGGLLNPRGFTWDSAGGLHVALAGVGYAVPARPDDETANLGLGSVARIDNLCPVTVASGLPTTAGMEGAPQGPSAVAFLDGQLYVLQDASYMGPVNLEQPNGVYAAEPDGTFRLVADISSWIADHPVANLPPDYTAAGETFAMVAGDGMLWVIESNSGQLLQVTPDGAISRIVDLSAGHPVPSGLALAPSGGVYIGFLTAVPYPDGGSKIIEVTPDGTVRDVWTGLTALTAVAVDEEGTLYALEMSTGNSDAQPYLQQGSGRVVRQTGLNSLEAVLTGLDFPVGMAFGPDGGLYVSLSAFSIDNQPGAIIKVDPSARALTFDSAILATSPCAVPVLPTPSGTPDAAC